MKGVYRFYCDMGRMGDIDGVFIAEKDDVCELIGKHVYFGEILGKHSCVEDNIEEDEIELLSDDQDFVNKCIEVFGDGTISGYNPLDYIEEEDEEDD